MHAETVDVLRHRRAAACADAATFEDWKHWADFASRSYDEVLEVLAATVALGGLACRQVPELVPLTANEVAALECHECPPCRLRSALESLTCAVEQAGTSD